jgi:hypothetical protein
MTLPEPLSLEIEEELGFPVWPNVWRYLEHTGAIWRFITGDFPMQDLLNEIRHMQQGARPPIPVRDAGPQMLTGDWTGAQDYTPRDEAVSRLVAEEAASDPEVRAFRRDPAHALPEQLLAWDELQAWLEEARSRDGHAGVPLPHSGALRTWWLPEVPVPDVYDKDVDRALRDPHAPDLPTIAVQVAPDQWRAQVSWRRLWYGTPGNAGREALQTYVGGQLDRLRQLSERLARQYGWTEAQAAVWVLTGIPPLIAGASAEAKERPTIPALSRITLHLDPTLSPREVAERYRQIRQYFMGKRYRPLSGKHLQLALFAAQQPTGTWAERMAQWNQEHREWTYSDASNFGRDCRQAQRRLLGTRERKGGDDA